MKTYSFAEMELIRGHDASESNTIYNRDVGKAKAEVKRLKGVVQALQGELKKALNVLRREYIIPPGVIEEVELENTKKALEMYSTCGLKDDFNAICGELTPFVFANTMRLAMKWCEK